MECSGASGVTVGIGRNPSRRVRLRRGGACGCRQSFLKGVRCSPSSPHRVPGETLGNNVVIVASLPEGVAWYRRSGALGAWWQASGGRSVCGACFLFSFRRCRLFSFSFSFSLRFSFGRCAVWPSSGLFWCGFIYKAGRKSVSRSYLPTL